MKKDKTTKHNGKKGLVKSASNLRKTKTKSLVVSGITSVVILSLVGVGLGLGLKSPNASESGSSSTLGKNENGGSLGKPTDPTPTDPTPIEPSAELTLTQAQETLDYSTSMSNKLKELNTQAITQFQTTSTPTDRETTKAELQQLVDKQVTGEFDWITQLKSQSRSLINKVEKQEEFSSQIRTKMQLVSEYDTLYQSITGVDTPPPNRNSNWIFNNSL